jgi:hypothetical protein
MSRIYGGIHFQFDNQMGLECGNALGEFTFANYLQVPSPAASLMLAAGGLAVAGRRRRN